MTNPAIVIATTCEAFTEQVARISRELAQTQEQLVQKDAELQQVKAELAECTTADSAAQA